MDEERSYLEALAKIGDQDAIIKLHHLCQHLGEEPPPSHYYLNLLQDELKENVRQRHYWRSIRQDYGSNQAFDEREPYLNYLDAKIDNLEDIARSIWKQVNQIRQF